MVGLTVDGWVALLLILLSHPYPACDLSVWVAVDVCVCVPYTRAALRSGVVDDLYLSRLPEQLV